MPRPGFRVCHDRFHDCPGAPTRRRRQKRGSDDPALGPRFKPGAGYVEVAFSQKLVPAKAGIHAVVDALGNPIRFKLSGGEEADCSWAIPALTDLEFGCLLADKGYDTDEILTFLKDRGATACIPPKENRTVQREYDKELYKERNLVERFFNRLKQFRRLATRRA